MNDVINDNCLKQRGVILHLWNMKIGELRQIDDMEKKKKSTIIQENKKHEGKEKASILNVGN